MAQALARSLSPVLQCILVNAATDTGLKRELYCRVAGISGEVLLGPHTVSYPCLA